MSGGGEPVLGAIAAHVEGWSLCAPRRARSSAAGDQSTHRLGPGLEFHDRRAYAAGDDLRQLDWRALARSDQAMVRLSQEERAPSLEVLVDLSASMGMDPQKARTTRDLVVLLCALGRRDGWPVSVVGLAAPPRPVGVDLLVGALDGAHPEVQAALAFRPGPHVGEAIVLSASQLRPGAVRVVVSDFLGGDLEAALAPLASGAGAVFLVQVLAREEREPSTAARVRLVDAETGAELEVDLDGAAVRRYRERLSALQGLLADGARRARGRWVCIEAERELGELLRGPLSEALLVEPAR